MRGTKTYSLSAKDIHKGWHVIDASGQTLGRLSTQVAGLLMGKHKPAYSRHLDMGDFVIIVNAAKLRVTGKKLDDKIYYRHSGYMGGLKETPLGDMLERNPGRVIELAVRGMLPRNRLSRHLLRHLKVYAGPEHPHEAQVNSSRKSPASAGTPRSVLKKPEASAPRRKPAAEAAAVARKGRAVGTVDGSSRTKRVSDKARRGQKGAAEVKDAGGTKT